MGRILSYLSAWWAYWSPWALRARHEELRQVLLKGTQAMRLAYDSGALSPGIRLELAKTLVMIGGEGAKSRPFTSLEDGEESWRGPIVMCMAQACVDEFKAHGGENYIEHTLHHRELGDFTFTLQRKMGVTPAEKNGKLTAELAKLRLAAHAATGHLLEALQPLQGCMEHPAYTPLASRAVDSIHKARGPLMEALHG